MDLIVVNSPNAYLGNVPNVKKIKDFQDVFIADKAFEELKGKKLSFKELLNYPILMLDRKSTTSEYLHNLFLQNQLDLVPEIELSSNDLLIDLARIGLGIAFIPDFCLSQTSDSDSLFIVETKKYFRKGSLSSHITRSPDIQSRAGIFILFLIHLSDA